MPLAHTRLHLSPKGVKEETIKNSIRQRFCTVPLHYCFDTITNDSLASKIPQTNRIIGKALLTEVCDGRGVILLDVLELIASCDKNIKSNALSLICSKRIVRFQRSMSLDRHHKLLRVRDVYRYFPASLLTLKVEC